MVLPPASRRLLIWRSLAHMRFSKSPCDFILIAKQLNCNVQHVTKTMGHVLVAVGVICMSINTNTNYHTITCCSLCFRNLVVNFAELFLQNMCTRTARIILAYQLISQRCLDRNYSWCELFHLKGGWITVLGHPWLLNLKHRLEYENFVITSAVWEETTALNCYCVNVLRSGWEGGYCHLINYVYDERTVFWSANYQGGNRAMNSYGKLQLRSYFLFLQFSQTMEKFSVRNANKDYNSVETDFLFI
jgi:hypothetical protein